MSTSPIPRPVLGHAVAGTLIRVLNRGALCRADALLNMMLQVANTANMKVVGKTTHQFEPEGATCVLLLEQSHFAIHTWPEHGSATVEIFSCVGQGQVQQALTLVKNAMQAAIVRTIEFEH